VNYRSIANLNDDVLDWSRRLPRDLDLIVGIPRSGLIVANLLALHLNLPLADVDGLLQGRSFGAGPRLATNLSPGNGVEPLTILVVDDSVWSGGQMAAVRQRIEACRLPHRVLYGAVYVLPSAVAMVDHYYERLGLPRAFEWNIMHHPFLEWSCVVADGVLWPDDLALADLDNGRFAEMPPLFRPSKRIGWLIANQPRRYRAVIEAWLNEHGIAYGDLVLFDRAPVVVEADREAVTRAKASLYCRTDAWILIEGALPAAALAARLSRRPVFCFETRQMIFPWADSTRRRRQPLGYRLGERLRDFRIRLVRKLRRLAGHPPPSHWR
jgi:orotate phosphoribosyltransferase